MPVKGQDRARESRDSLDSETGIAGADSRLDRVAAGREDPAASVEIGEALARRVIIARILPAVDGGRFAIKRTAGEFVDVAADIFADGHDVIGAVVRDRHVGPRGSGGLYASRSWRESPMTLVQPGTDEWAGRFEVEGLGWHEYAVVAWIDRFRSWRRDLQIKAAAGQDISLELLEGASLVRDAASRAAPRGSAAARLLGRAEMLAGAPPAAPVAQRIECALSEDLASLMDAHADRTGATVSPAFRVWVDRERARFGAWYEMFPRSAGPLSQAAGSHPGLLLQAAGSHPGLLLQAAGSHPAPAPDRSGTFQDAAGRLPYIADLGFDVVYLPPIHPIGRTARKGHGNNPVASSGDPGSPWAIGSEAGGHTEVEPGLGTLEDFESFRLEAERLGLEVALDLAWQCSPDHPWVREHPEWFRHRPDGTIKYAENPPKKYQDIYPIDFACADWRALWRELLRVTLVWVDRGVRIFRVDNPHTKTLGFWEWLIGEVHARDPRVIFLSEAFTRPKPMLYLAKSGFTQSYTYFTWRNTKQELIEYFSELTGASAANGDQRRHGDNDIREYLRPNLFANTPDILHAYLQEGGRPAFEARLILAATLGASYGIYNGFELAENRAVPGTEEYAESEKYQLRAWDWNRPGHIKELVRQVNQIRRQHRALHFDWTLRFHETDNPQIIAYSKSIPAWPIPRARAESPAGAPAPAGPVSSSSGLVYVVVNLDPHRLQHGWVQAPLDLAGVPEHDSYIARDLLDDAEYGWQGARNYVRLEPGVRQGHIFSFRAKG